MPEPPGSWSEAPATLLDALAEASLTCDDQSTRYALDSVQLRGADGSVVATDGHQLFVQAGFPFPWAEDVLVRRSPLFASRELQRNRPVAIGRTDTHVVLRVGPWTISLEIRTGVRFPKTEDVVPDASAAATRLRIDPADAQFLLPALERLPGADEPHAPATVDLNGRIAVRARASDRERTTELVLARSAYSGAPVRWNTDREFLARALRLGFTDFEIVAAETPVVCRDGRRIYAWQPLSKESALAPSDDAIRIESVTITPVPAGRPGESPNPRNPMSHPRQNAEKSTRNGTTIHEPGPTGPESRTAPAGPSGLAGLIKEAEALQEMLGQARSRSQRLVAALRRHRRQARLMTGALEALKQLRLQEAVE